MPTIEIEIDAFTPDYRHECEHCGTSPVVTGTKDGKIIYQPHLCGICYFQDEDYLEPEDWP